MNQEYLNPENIEAIEEIDLPKGAYVIADERVFLLYKSHFESCDVLLLRAGEADKSLAGVERIWQYLSERGAGRDASIHVFGGGSISDIAAFAISTFKRGCRLILYPSTLMGMIDASIGGKTGFNYSGLKNHIGSFYPAEKIFLYHDFLESLPEDEIRQGLAEILKCKLLDSELPAFIMSPGETPDIDCILEYARYKMHICMIDPWDRAIRRLLNFGHSFGHALESLSNFELKHGDAVYLGMKLAARYSHDQGLLSKKGLDEYDMMLSGYPLPVKHFSYLDRYSSDELLPLLLQDKKSGSRLCLILPTDDGIRAFESVVF